MVQTASTMIPLGSDAAAFELPDPQGKMVRLSDFADHPVLVVIFMCNHCPFVKHIGNELADLARTYQQRGVGLVAINPNDVANYPDDSPEKMAEAIKEYGYTFPYLYDESQEIAKAYQAACTPDFFVYNAERQLVYRGQMDDSRPNNEQPVTGADLRSVLDALLDGGAAPAMQKPSIGCNIKWKSGNEPAYFTA